MTGSGPSTVGPDPVDTQDNATQYAEYVRLQDLPLPVINALIGPVYEALTEDQAMDCVADRVVELQLAELRRWGWDLRRIDGYVSEGDK